jgi:hypothetical protein
VIRLSSKSALAAICAVGLAVSSVAHAQSIFGFKVGDDLRVAAKAHPQPSVMDALGSYAVVKWSLANGNAISVTASPETGSIVYVESDWGGDARNAVSEVPGLTFGQSNLADIRAKFGSNGFGFKSNVAQVSDKDLISINCYQVAGHENLVVAFVTRLPISSVPVENGQPKVDTGKGRLDAVILADLAYLQGLWGKDRLFDPAYRAIDWK